jgi:hypothetical protein
MATNSFVSRKLKVYLTLAQGAFGASPDFNNTKIVDGLRVNCDIRKSGSPSRNECVLHIYGMLQSDMDQLSTLGNSPLAVRKNLVQVLAGDSDGLASAFLGEITGAWVNYRTPPNLYFEVHAMAAHYASLVPIQPTSLAGGVPVATIFQNLASQMGYFFQNNGVTATVQNPYLAGTATDQAAELARMAGLEYGIDDGMLFIAPKGQPRPAKGIVPVITPSSGMQEYPIWDKQGLVVEALYDPGFQLGGLVNVAGSMVTRANGTWRVHGLHHRLASHDPGHGAWHTTLNLAKAGV